MVIRHLGTTWAALAVGLLLASGAGAPVRADDCDNCGESRWDRFCDWCRGDDDCDDGCRRRHRCRFCKKRCRGNSCCRCIKQVDPGYVDSRDLEMYAAQGYDVPVAVPLAPVVKHTYNYGWGVPSSRLTRVGAHYTRWHPEETFTQTGGRMPGSYPIYQPTDTTQTGFYHVHAPRWGRWTTY